ncbi:SAM-dependent methyltransferase [Nonomuraea diastatica]|uniref:SAM-dependent methyltransferase n=1 Tax=Nonomuraea diastatica TaxID=1848329 RepID=A0A4R4VVE1_9ACTN|nr:SAM-dependent methyltransferase [Nonomuraea diastatica]TDD08247.1 SAM-dependent methyltransferase [Nonomuraea diastatica]
MIDNHTTSPPAGVNPSTPSIARVYDYLLGGRDNFAVDRQLAEQVLKVAPNARTTAQANRSFLVRATEAVVRAGIGQFIDLGIGIPTSPNVHEVAQRINPDARVAYVDNDPIVLVHARALLSRIRSDVITLKGGLRDPKEILDRPKLRAHIDFAQPTAFLLVAVLHLLTNEDRPERLMEAIRDRMAPGSYLILSHLWDDPDGVARAGAGEYAHHKASASVVPRTRGQIQLFFDGFELVEPGLVFLDQWRPTQSMINAGAVVDLAGVVVDRVEAVEVLIQQVIAQLLVAAMNFRLVVDAEEAE